MIEPSENFKHIMPSHLDAKQFVKYAELLRKAYNLDNDDIHYMIKNDMTLGDLMKTQGIKR